MYAFMYVYMYVYVYIYIYSYTQLIKLKEVIITLYIPETISLSLKVPLQKNYIK